MKRIRILTVSFTSNIAHYEVPAFRGAIVEKVGRENIIFHNHLNNNSFLYKYPLVQYKKIRDKAAIMCIDYAVDEIHKYFDKKNWDIKIGNKDVAMEIANLNMNQFNMQVWNHKFFYTINNWLALNQENFKKFFALKEDEKLLFLENILKANILSFAKGIEWSVDKPIELSIEDNYSYKTTTFKSQKLVSFNCKFKTNVFLPNYIGLGKGVSLGYGIVKAKKNIEKNKN